MKSLKQICEDHITHPLYEVSILADIDDQINAFDNSIPDRIEKWIKENYNCYGKLKISDKPNDDGLYEVTVHIVDIKNKNITSLTNGLFVWKKVNNNFMCNGCKKLSSLEGAPEYVGGYFYCHGCKLLKSLEGAPEKVGGNFSCAFCHSIKSLEGAPKEVKGDFDCCECSNLKSLEGASQKVGRDFYCYYCKTKFTEDDVKKVSDVKGEIYV